MSLKEEDRRIIVEMELGKAERTFAEQKLLRVKQVPVPCVFLAL